MVNFTPIVRIAASVKAKQTLKAAAACERTQRQQLASILRRCASTAIGRDLGLRRDMSYEEFAAAIAVNDYEFFRPYVMRMVNGERNVLWPGVTRKFAQSSGTSGGKSKYIPITAESLRRNHYAGASLAVMLYLFRYPDSRMFAGKGFILGGSFANELDLPPGVRVGDLSASLINDVGPIVDYFRVPKREIALMENWEKKLPALVDAAVGEDVTNISGVPSWFLTVLKRVIDKSSLQSATEGKPASRTIHDVWPNLEVFFHGGISFEPYRSEYEKITEPKMRYWETYNASEGFFAAQSDVDDAGMLLLQNIGVFYEFVPLNEISEPFPHAVPAWKVKKGETYAMIITSCNGLLRYALGDTVKIESVSPIKITIAGRTHNFINAFGEELMVYNTDAALSKACKLMDCSISDYTVAPVYAEGKKKGRHQWLIEWNKKPENIEAFSLLLDKLLQDENSDYQAKRGGDIFLSNLEVVSASPGLFDKWLGMTGKLGGQRKVPRLSNDRKVMEQMLELLNQ